MNLATNTMQLQPTPVDVRLGHELQQALALVTVPNSSYLDSEISFESRSNPRVQALVRAENSKKAVTATAD
jgi:hypothetical protein